MTVLCRTNEKSRTADKDLAAAGSARMSLQLALDDTESDLHSRLCLSVAENEMTENL